MSLDLSYCSYVGRVTPSDVSTVILQSDYVAENFCVTSVHITWNLAFTSQFVIMFQLLYDSFHQF